MIRVSDNIQLQDITINDQEKLMDLAWKIYPIEYNYLWKNKDCNWYLNKCYGIENFNNELLEDDANYCFVIYNSKIEGLIRFVYNKPLNGISNKQATYLHRIYISQELQGKGVAQKLYNWVEQKSKLNGIDYIWLEAMSTKDRAVHFYKKNGFKIIDEKQLKFELMTEHLRGIYIMSKTI